MAGDDEDRVTEESEPETATEDNEDVHDDVDNGIPTGDGSKKKKKKKKASSLTAADGFCCSCARRA